MKSPRLEIMDRITIAGGKHSMEYRQDERQIGSMERIYNLFFYGLTRMLLTSLSDKAQVQYKLVIGMINIRNTRVIAAVGCRYLRLACVLA